MTPSFFHEFIKEHKIEEVECFVPDMTGVARGKIIPADKFIDGLHHKSLKLPEDTLLTSVTGRYVPSPNTVRSSEPDMYLLPSRIPRILPWCTEPTLGAICNCFHSDDRAVDIAPRYVLKKIIQLYEDQGWRAVVAPELEFYLVAKNIDPDYPLEPPPGKTGRTEVSGQAYGIDAANEFDPVIEDIYDYCEAQNIHVGTLSHESGPAQLEINFDHGAPLEVADQVFLFKRAVRMAALKHGIYATFMAKPHEREPGSSMHIHQSVVSMKTGKNIFSTSSNKETKLLQHYIGGLQKYMTASMPFFAPSVNSYRRLVVHSDAPTNTHWGYDNRTTALRIPESSPASKRVENRVPGADANPYLAIGASLACGFLGMTGRLKPSDPVSGTAYRYAHGLPLTLEEAIGKFNYAKPLKKLLGERFSDAYLEVKSLEIEQYREVISSWERQFLLLNV